MTADKDKRGRVSRNPTAFILCAEHGTNLVLLVQVQSRVFTAKCSEPQVGISNEDHWCLIPEGVDPELLMKVLGNPEMAALLTSLAKTMKV